MTVTRNAEACLRRLMYYFETPETLVVNDQKFSKDVSHISQQTMSSRFPSLTISQTSSSVSISSEDYSSFCDFMTFVLKCSPITKELFDHNRKKKPSVITPRRYDKDDIHSHGPNLMKFESPHFLTKNPPVSKPMQKLSSEVVSLPHPKIEAPIGKQSGTLVITKRSAPNKLLITKKEESQNVTIRLMDPKKFQAPAAAPPLDVLLQPPPLTGPDPVLDASPAKVTFSLPEDQPTFNPEPIFDTMWKTVQIPTRVIQFDRKRSDVPIMTKMDLASAAIKSTESQLALYPYLKMHDSQLNAIQSQKSGSRNARDLELPEEEEDISFEYEYEYDN